MFYSVEIAANIALLRKAYGLTLEEAASRAGISVTCWKNIEYGCNNTTEDTLRAIAGVLKVSPLILVILSMPDAEILEIQCKSMQEQRPQVKILCVGEGILLLRKTQGLTQKQLAAMSHISTARLRDIEHGCANASVNTLERIAASLNISLLVLIAHTFSEAELLHAVHLTRQRLETMRTKGAA